MVPKKPSPGSFYLLRKFHCAMAGIIFCLLITSCATAPIQEKEAPAALQKETVTEPLAFPKRSSSRAHLGFPLATFTEDNFIGSGRCAICHSKLVDSAGNDMSISNHWRATMLANAAKDPFWQAKVASEASRNPAIKQIIEEKCTTCHMPMAWTQTVADQKQYKVDKPKNIFDEFTDSRSRLNQAAMDGVSCSLCHQIQDKALGTEKSFSGKYVIDTKIPPPDRPIFGPYRDVLPEPMRTSVGFNPVYGQHINDSALCATCHTLYTPYLDATGNVAGVFPEQNVYMEWLHSAYAEPLGQRHDIGETVGEVKICQECHMPHSQAGGVMIAHPVAPKATKKDHFSQHHFVGGNVFMLNILQDNLSPLGITASTEKLEDTKQRTLKQLQTNTARLSIIEARRTGNTLTAKLRVESLVGHKFPAGFPSRRTWLHFTVTDGAGDVVFESGRPREDGSVTGDNADENMSYEPHYDLVSEPDQVQIYESVMKNTEGEVTYTLLRGADYIKDNRLLPPGFDKKTAHNDIATKGNAAEDDNFIGGADTITYKVKVGGHKGPFTVKAQLYYVPISYTFLQDLKEDENLYLVSRFIGYYEKADKTPATVAALISEVP